MSFFNSAKTWVTGVVTTIVGGLIVLFVGTSIYERTVATSEIEYRVTDVGALFYCPQGLENRVHIDLDGKPYKNVYMVRIDLYNRTTRSFSDVPIQIRTVHGSAKLLGKMLLYPSDQDSDRFAWDTTDTANLNFMARGLNTAVHEPNVSFNLFFDDDKLPEVELATSRGGISFTPYEDSKIWLFKYDFVVLIILVGIPILGLSIFGITQLATRKARQRVAAYNRIFTVLYQREVDNAREIQVTTAKELSGTNIVKGALIAHLATNTRLDLSEKGDKKAIAKVEKLLAKIREADAKKLAEATVPPQPTQPAAT